MKVKVCDALCGQGKTQSCIRMMNKDTEHKFIFVTPYLSEVDRILSACSRKKFVAPEGSRYPKIGEIENMIRTGKNIVTTHALFSSYTEEIKEFIRSQKYTLVLDETVDLYRESNVDASDIEFLEKLGYVEHDGVEYSWTGKKSPCKSLEPIYRMMSSHKLVSRGSSFFFWEIPLDVFTCFDDAYILTYMFDSQPIRWYFDMYHIEYELIGTKPVPGGAPGDHMFCPLEEMNRKIDLRDKIIICENSKYNAIGRDSFSLSASWYERDADNGFTGINTLRKNIRSFHRSVKEDIATTRSTDDLLWTSFKEYADEIGKGGTRTKFIPYNQRATNEYADRTILAFCVNVFPLPWITSHAKDNGVENIQGDMYALSVMIQWIFRSAIRKGETVHLYVPSKRMRTLLQIWLDHLAAGNDLEPIHYSKIHKQEYIENTKTAEHMSKMLHEVGTKLLAQGVHKKKGGKIFDRQM